MRIVSRDLTQAGVTNQTKPNQVKNHAGGYVFQASDMDVLSRFLILGTEGGTYYVNQRTLTLEMTETVSALITLKGKEVLSRVAEVSLKGLAPRQDSTIFTIALLLTYGTVEVKQATAAMIPQLCRTGTMLFQLVGELDNLRGWGRSARRAIANWYTSKTDNQLVYQTTKYRNRNGWSHKDVLRLCHAKGGDNPIYNWLVGKNNGKEINLLKGFLTAQSTKDVDTLLSLIEVFKLEREHIPTEFLTNPKVNEKLLENMKYMAVIRNLGNMTKYGVITPLNKNEDLVCNLLRCSNDLKASRVHPIQLLQALVTYKSGTSDKGSGTWNPSSRVSSCLEEAFYMSFDNVEPTGLRYLLGLDVSGSMYGSRCTGSTMKCIEAQTAMALVTRAKEDKVHTVLYDTSVYEYDMNPKDSLTTHMNRISGIGRGGTDCSLPVRYALEKGIEVDVFVIYTDSETWHGAHPYKLLEEYHKKVNPNARLINVQMATNSFTVANPDDNRTLNVVGFDPSVPSIIRSFSLGEM